jgi:uncharacterized protein
MPAARTAAVPVTVSQYVLKVHSRCDLACDHCYVYEHADQSWRVKPRAISLATADTAARRIAEHAAAHRLPRVSVILHGGEPLLLGRTAMRSVLSALVTRITPVTRLDLRIHSNAVRLDEPWCELFDEYGVKVGVSLDGDEAANDRHRRFADGRSSYARVLLALALLRRPEFRHLFAGILCTIDLANDPLEVYTALVTERPPRIDLLLPNATWDNPPHRPPGQPHPYADWLLAVYRRWVQDGRPVPIRLFDSVFSAARGGPSWTEAIGLDRADLLVIDTDGSWEQADSLKTAFDRAPATGMRVQEHSVDDAALHPGVVARQGGLRALCATCRACPVVQICGGGLYAHRYSSETGFGNPSAYCADLMELIRQLTATPPEVTVTHADQAAWPVHRLPAGAFEALAGGPGDVVALTALGELRLSQARALVAAVGREAGSLRHPELRAAAAAGWALLCDLDVSHPGAVADVLSHPYTQVWALRCLKPPPGADVGLDRAHLAGIAAAAALRAGVVTELPVPVRHGLAHLPSYGALATGMGAGSTVLVQVAPGRLPRVSRGPAGAVPGERGWRSARSVSGPELQVAVEDLDPFRDCQDVPATGRMAGREWLAWRRALATAGRRLARDVPGYARALRAGLRTVVPLRPAVTGLRSATARRAFGAVAVALPADPRYLDELLVHEFQHAKLFALCDLYELYDITDTQLLSVPWRPDPRPVDGVLHGVYAHLALAQLSRSRGAAGHDSWLRYESWVRRACDALWETEALTPDGERFVTGMLAALDSDGAMR